MNIALFVDTGNLYYCMKRAYPSRKIVYSKYVDKVREIGNLDRMKAYGTYLEREAISFMSCLKHLGFDTSYIKAIPGRHFDWTTGIAMDVVRLADRKYNTIVLGTSSPTILPLVKWIKEQGTRVVIFACGISKDLRAACDQYIEIDEGLFDENSTSAESMVVPADSL